MLRMGFSINLINLIVSQTIRMDWSINDIILNGVKVTSFIIKCLLAFLLSEKQKKRE